MVDRRLDGEGFHSSALNSFPHRLSLLWALVLAGLPAAASDGTNPASPVPRTWETEAIASLEVPLGSAEFSPKHVSADYYYRIPVRPIYRSYPVFHPHREPPGYFASLQLKEPEIVWNEENRRPPLQTEADWIRAGEVVFDAPVGYGGVMEVSEVRDPSWYENVGARVARDGTLPEVRYVIREKGRIELGTVACAHCHTRVLPDGSVLKGAQSNFPFQQARSQGFRSGRRSLHLLHELERSLFSAPWLESDPARRLARMSDGEILALGMVTPAGVIARARSSPFSPVQVPDLIGLQDRRYLDRTGLVQHRSIGDLMRYVALNQGADDLSSFGDFVPIQVHLQGRFPEDPKDPEAGLERYSDEQLYALARYLYSLQPPPNPNPFDTGAARGKELFQREGCAQCHPPPLYTNNQLMPVAGYTVGEKDRRHLEIMSRSIDTDPTLTLHTRRGTGYYKVPSLLGLWYRGPFEHSGSCAALEDWFDPRRLSGDYVPTGWKGPPGTQTRAVIGHEFGLDLSADDRRALIAFLKTL